MLTSGKSSTKSDVRCLGVGWKGVEGGEEGGVGAVGGTSCCLIGVNDYGLVATRGKSTR